MYKIIGADGNEYGPVSLEQLKQWAAEGRVNARTRVQPAGAAGWRNASDVPELGVLLGAPPPASVPSGVAPPIPLLPLQTGLATASLVLGIAAVLCFGLLTGIPAIICGHIARSRVRNFPGQYGGKGLALAGLILGYVGLLFTLLLPAMLLPALARAKDRAQRVACVNNMKQIGLAFKVWALDNTNQYPFNVSTNAGGTLELTLPGADGYDGNPALQFRVMSNELSTPRILVCPGDSAKQPAQRWEDLQPANVTYRVHAGPNVDETHPEEVLAVCPVHRTVLLCDGSVQQKPRPRKVR